MNNIFLIDPDKYKASIPEVFARLFFLNKDYLWLSIANCLANQFLGNLPLNPIVNIDSLAKLIRFLERMPNFGFFKPSSNYIHEIFQKINSLDQKYEFIENNNSIESIILQLSFRQWEFNGSDRIYKIIITSLAYSSSFKKHNLNQYAENCFKHKHQVTYDQYEAYVFILYTFFLSNKGFGNIKETIEKAKNESEKESFLNFIDSIALKQNEFRIVSKRPKYNIRKPFYTNLSIFQDFPIIKSTKFRYICPSISYLLNKYSKGTYYEINNYYIQNNDQKKRTRRILSKIWPRN